jgi:hypothetical protein
MFALILIFYGAAVDPTSAAHVILFSSHDACMAKANNIVSYQQGVEAGHATPSKVVGYCVPVMVDNAGPTT